MNQLKFSINRNRNNIYRRFKMARKNFKYILYIVGCVLFSLGATFFIASNLGTNPLFVRFGSGASTTVFNMVLKGGTGNDDGLGASYEQSNGVVYTGIITIAGTSPRYIATEMTK